MNNSGTSYLLWCGCLLGLNGLHRLYNGKVASGLIWLFTFGLCGVGQLVDLALIPAMVDEYNLKYQARLGGLKSTQVIVERVIEKPPLPEPLTPHQLKIRLLKAAQARGGKISVAQGVLETEADFPEVEAVLRDLVKNGHADIGNDPSSGVIIYIFPEL